MDSRRFDSLVQRLALRSSRRAALKGATALAATGLLTTHRTTAQEATPAFSASTPVPPLAPGMSENHATLFVQTASSGTFGPNPRATGAAPTGSVTATDSQPGTYLLTLQGHNGETIAFSDRPERTFSEAPTPRFLQVMGFTSADPPNAALVVDSPDQERAVILLELLNPTYDPDTQILTYEAELLQTYPNDPGRSLAPIAGTAQPIMPPTSFSSVSLFIDDCPDGQINCHNPETQETTGLAYPVGFCYNAASICCSPCAGQDHWTAQCNSQEGTPCLNNQGNGICYATWSEEFGC